MEPLPKKTKRQLNPLVSQAYENELSQKPAKLAEQFDSGRANKIPTGELAHKVDTGPLRELYKQYNGNPYRELWIAGALERGLLQEQEIPREVRPYLQRAIAFIQAHVGEDDVDDD